MLEKNPRTRTGESIRYRNADVTIDPLFRVIDLFSRDCWCRFESALRWSVLMIDRHRWTHSLSDLGNHQGEIFVFSIPSKGANILLKETIPGEWTATSVR